MAIARLSVKVGKLGKALPHASYISRLGVYAKRLDTGEKLEATGQGNMPEWAAHNPLMFWQQADQNERKNGATYREHELALPRELNPTQRLDLLQDWVKQEIGDKYAYQYAIHNPKSLDGGENPHVHLMFSERRLDGIERDPQQFFKRYNSKHPERGGCKKDNTGIKPAERKELLAAQRKRWEELTNQHLERAGRAERIDMRSYKDQGLDIQPEPKMLPSEWRNPAKRAEIIDFREAKKQLLAARKELNQLVPKMRKAMKESKVKANARLTPERIKRIREQHHNKMETAYQQHLTDLADKLQQQSKAHETLQEELQQHGKTLPNPDDYRVLGYISDKALKRYEKAGEAYNKELNRLKKAVESSAARMDELSHHPTFDYFSKEQFKKNHPEVLKEEARIFEKQRAELKARITPEMATAAFDKELSAAHKRNEAAKDQQKEEIYNAQEAINNHLKAHPKQPTGMLAGITGAHKQYEKELAAWEKEEARLRHAKRDAEEYRPLPSAWYEAKVALKANKPEHYERYEEIEKEKQQAKEEKDRKEQQQRRMVRAARKSRDFGR